MEKDLQQWQMIGDKKPPLIFVRPFHSSRLNLVLKQKLTHFWRTLN